MRSAALLMLASLSACGPTTYREFCNEDATATCTNAFKCDRERAETSWKTHQGCVDDLSNSGSCREAGSKTCYLEPDVSRRCIDDLEKASCEQRTSRPESCAAVVCVDDSKIRCQAAETTFPSGGCERTRTQCSDGAQYRIECTATKCTCHRGGDEGRDFDRGTFCEDGPALQDAAFAARCMYAF